MKEFIEKLIGRLEEEKESAKRRNAFDSELSYKRAIEIVNQLAEEYNNESVKGDLISRSELIKALNESGKQPLLDDDIEAYCDGWNDAVDIMNNQPTAYNDGWIPCSDAVPQDGDWVLCYGTNREGRIKYEVSTYAHEIQCWMCSRIAEVIAWKPIAPYQPKGE